MKFIKIVTYSNFPFGGASANYLRYFALSLSLNSANRVEVVLPTGNSFGDQNDLNTTREGSVGDVTYKHLSFINRPVSYIGKVIDNLWGHLSPIFYLICQRLRRAIDVIVVYNTSFTITLIFLLIKRIIGRDLIIILPEYYEPPAKLLSVASIKWINFYFGISFLVKHADKFIVLSDYLQKYLMSRGVPEERILILPNITDPNIFSVQNVKQHKEGLVTIGYSGTPTRKDGINDLLESFAVLTKKFFATHLLIIGDLQSGSTVIPELRRRAESLGISNKVTFTGLVSYKEIPVLLNSCQILALTRPSGVSAEAGFPTKLGEYFACRKPVLVTSVGDIKKYFINGVHAVIVSPDDIESIVAGFESLILNEDLREQVVTNAYHWMDENLAYQNLSQKINNFIQIPF